jgi:hypothetical protein
MPIFHDTENEQFRPRLPGGAIFSTQKLRTTSVSRLFFVAEAAKMLRVSQVPNLFMARYETQGGPIRGSRVEHNPRGI